MKTIAVVVVLLVLGGVQLVSAGVDAPVAMDDDQLYNRGSIGSGADWVYAWWMGEFCYNILYIDPFDPPPAGPLYIEIVSGPTHGHFVEFSEHSALLWYVPEPYFLGEDEFSYELSVGSEYYQSGAVSILVGPGFNAPDASEDVYSTITGTRLDVPAPGVLENDYNVVSGCGMEAVLIESPVHGALCFNADGSFTYAPEPGFIGTDEFLYVAGVQAGDFHFSYYTPVTITVYESQETPVPEFPGGFLVICGIILGSAVIAARMRIRR